MKTCPNCGSILADNEPYCENCGFDPDFDMGGWNYGQHKSTRKPYIHGDYIKNPGPYVLGKEVDTILFIIALAILLFVIFIPFYNNDNIYIMIIFLIAFVIVSSACMLSESSNNKSNKFKIDKKRHEKLKKQYSKEINCPKCGNTIKAKAVKCKHCGYYLKRWSEDSNKQKPINAKKHLKTESKIVNKSNYKKINRKYSQYERCPKCNSLVNMELNSICSYCNYDILSENVKYCRFCATKMPVNATVCRNCKRPIEKT